MKEFSNVCLVVVHSNVNINMDSNKRVHKQTNKHVWAFKQREIFVSEVAEIKRK